MTEDAEWVHLTNGTPLQVEYFEGQGCRIGEPKATEWFSPDLLARVYGIVGVYALATWTAGRRESVMLGAPTC